MSSVSAQPGLVYVGIDEAGYGPTLGPLCVGFAAFVVREWSPGAAAPDLWKQLRRAVCKTPKEARSSGKLAVNDSKKLKGPGVTCAGARDGDSAGPRHPLHELELGVLSFLRARREAGDPGTDAQLFGCLGASMDELPWYLGDDLPVPLSTTRDHLSVCAAKLSGACERSGVELADLACRTLAETAFNERLETTANKATVSFGIVGSLLRRVWESESARSTACIGGPRVMVDRQGGRVGYGPALEAAIPGARVQTLAETEAMSRYEVVGGGEGGEERRMQVAFAVEAENRHLPVALASMAAKLTRELSMARFNRYWCGRISELKPTAGYSTDARRWLTDIAPHSTETERRLLVRRA